MLKLPVLAHATCSSGSIAHMLGSGAMGLTDHATWDTTLQFEEEQQGRHWHDSHANRAILLPLLILLVK